MSYGMSNGALTSTVKQEKHEMQGLNDRLAAYIQRVRKMRQMGPGSEGSYADAMKQLEDEMLKLKQAYDQEMDRLRKALEESNRQKHQLANLNDKNQAALQELHNKLALENQRCRAAQDELTNLQRALAQREKELAEARAELRQFQAEGERMRPEFAKLKRENDELKRKLEDEVGRRAAAEEGLKQRGEKAEFDRQMLEQRNRELQDRLKAAGDIINNLEAKIRKLSGGDDVNKMVQKLRDENEEALRKYQRTTEDALNRSIAELKEQIDKDARDKERMMKENEHLKDCLRQMQKKLNDIDSQLHSTKNENDQLKRQLEAERGDAHGKIKELNDRIRDLQEQLMEKMKDYNDARDAQASLRAEIDTYRKLLEAEDQRTGDTSRMQSPSYAKGTGSGLPDINKSGKVGTPPGTAPGYKTTYRVSYNRQF